MPPTPSGALTPLAYQPPETQEDVLQTVWDEVYATRRVALYLWGAPGSGKSALVRRIARLARAAGMVVVFTDAEEENAPEVAATLAGYGPGGADARPLREGGAGGARLLWVVEGADRWPEPGRFYRRILERLAEGIQVLMTGREHPGRLWAGLPAWSDTVAAIQVPELHPEQVAAWVAGVGPRGLTGPWEEWYALSGGRPGALERMADAVRLWQQAQGDAGLAAPGQLAATERTAFLFEHVVHPASRREQWRAGLGGAALDSLVAALVLVPFGGRPLLAAMVGPEPVAAGWGQLESLPIVRRTAAGEVGLGNGLRWRLGPLVAARRPWARERWWQRACGYYIDRIAQDPPAALRAGTVRRVLALVPHARGFRNPEGLFPYRPAWGWREEDGGPVRRLPVRLGDWGAAEAALLRDPGAALVVRDLTGVPRAVAPVRERGGRLPEAELLLAAWDDRDPQAERLLGLGLAHRLAAVPRVTVPAGVPTPGGILDPLPWETRGSRRELDWGWTGAALVPWLRGLLPEEDGAGREVPAGLVQEALMVLNEPGKLEAGALGRRLKARFGLGTGTEVRAWVLDALISLDLGPGEDGRELLRLYYVERWGPHERIADRLHLSRASYFRCHRRSLLRLGMALLDPAAG